ncbi:MAG: hypothetical protein ACPGIC_06785 [Opitutales bacterium]
MMETEDKQEDGKLKGLQYARWAGRAMGLGLLFMGFFGLSDGEGRFEAFKGLYWMVYGLVLLLPFERLREKFWRPGFVVLAALSALFVFVMVVHVMFAYMAAAEVGEKLGVPGLEGSLIFLGLLQVPVVLFQHKPDLLD